MSELPGASIKADQDPIDPNNLWQLDYCWICRCIPTKGTHQNLIRLRRLGRHNALSVNSPRSHGFVILKMLRNCLILPFKFHCSPNEPSAFFLLESWSFRVRGSQGTRNAKTVEASASTTLLIPVSSVGCFAFHWRIQSCASSSLVFGFQSTSTELSGRGKSSFWWSRIRVVMNRNSSRERANDARPSSWLMWTKFFSKPFSAEERN